MAQFNEILEGGLNQVIIKRLGMQVGTAVPAVQPELAVDLTLESDRIEWGFLKGEYRFSGAQVTAVPAAGEHAYVGLQNPANSGNICVVERIYVSQNSRVGTTATTPPVGAGVTSRSVDTRIRGNGSAALAQGAIPTASLPTFQEYMATNSEMTSEWVVTPGNWLIVSAFAAATATTVSIRWRERPAVLGELG